MKKRGHKFERFLVFVFTMNRGERKDMSPEEVNRGLTDHGPQTLYTIPVVTRGRFCVVRSNHQPLFLGPGDGGFSILDGDGLSGLACVALEDGSEYHCIMPRDRKAKFWNRRVITVQKDETLTLLPGEYAYVASGKLVDVPEKLIYNPTEDSRQYAVEEDSIFAIMADRTGA
jgi:hypothetical protein